jgi:hypothetical protein
MTDGERVDAPTLADLDLRLREVEAVQQLILRVLATTSPLDKLLAQFGATETQERAFYQMLDELVDRSRGPVEDRPTFGYFVMQLDKIFPSQRGNREFVELLLDTLKLARSTYRELHEYMEAQGWPAWT